MYTLFPLDCRFDKLDSLCASDKKFVVYKCVTSSGHVDVSVFDNLFNNYIEVELGLDMLSTFIF